MRGERLEFEAKDFGLAAIGVSRADALMEEASHVEQWLAQGCEGDMSYLTRNKEKRYDPRLLVEGTLSVVTVLDNYYPQQEIGSPNGYKIAKYAYGTDYHVVLKEKLRKLFLYIETQTGKIEGARAFVDSAPVLDRAWAVKCGLGFIGKNTSLIHPKKGSFFFIGHLFLPVALEPTGQPMANHCGQCTRCLDACPTGALYQPFHIDARKCLSYLTIEHKGSLEGNNSAQFQRWIYGCDACQDACPYNKKFSIANTEPLYQPSERLRSMRDTDWENLDKQAFDELFKDSAVKRAGYEGLRRNITFLMP